MSHARLFGKLPLPPTLLFLSALALALTLAGLLVAGGIAQGANRAAPSGSAGTITVTTNGDTVSCGTPCSLRGAIAVASSGDTIIIPAGTYTLTLQAELGIDKDLILTGAGSGDTIIQAGTAPGVASFRVFNIISGAVAISGVAVRNGNSSGEGGGIRNSGTLTLTNSSISDNDGTGGGGIYNTGTLTLTNSAVRGNTTFGSGGGIRSDGTLTVIQSTVSGNTAGYGGGIQISNGTLTLTNSTVRDNGSDTHGGGIINYGTLTLADSTVSDNTSSARGGGGIYNEGTGTLTNMTVSGNTTSGNGGGGITNFRGTLILTNSTVSGNTASSNGGGGIWNAVDSTMTLINSAVNGNTGSGRGGGIKNIGTMTVTNSTVSGNTASADSGGGGILNQGALTLTNSTVRSNKASIGGGIYNILGTLTLTDSTVSGNTASADSGGGIYNSSTVTLANSTVSGNTASGNGGGIFNSSGSTLTLANSTVAANVAETGSGGGIRNVDATAKLVNTIVAGNTSSSGPDCSGNNTSLGYNLIGDTTGCIFAAASGDLQNLDPKLSPLADNGGPTQTHALFPGSPAIDAGNPATPGSGGNACPATDQRGVARPQGARCDIGAFELDPNAPKTITVTKTGDTDATCIATGCSLREAIKAAVSGDTVAVPAGTYTLTLGSQLTIDKNLTLTGAGSGDTIVQAAATKATANHGVLTITSGIVVAISSVTIRHGEAQFGGGIQNNGTLTVTDSTISGNNKSGIHNGGTLTVANRTVRDNTASGTDAGGIRNSGTLTLTNSTVSNNTAGEAGGGIESRGTLTVTGTTISGNTATWDGGGIYSVRGSSVTITNSTISGNRTGPESSRRGGGIYQGEGLLTLNNTTVTANTAGQGAGIFGPATLKNTIVAGNRTGLDYLGTATTQGYNLVGDTSAGAGFTGDGDQTNVTDPKLGPLLNNGGPTKTHALLPGSPAIDGGNPATPGSGGNACPATDQRGVARPRGARCDIGAFEGVPTTPGTPSLGGFMKTGDSDGTCIATDCSLREAIKAAASGDTIAVPEGIYTLTLGSELTIKVNLTLNGAGSGDTIIQAAASSGDATHRVFTVQSGNTVSISGVTVRHGRAIGGGGGGILNNGDLTLTDSAVNGSTAVNGQGGGIFNYLGTLTVENSVVKENSSMGVWPQYGGGIANWGGSLTVIRSLVSRNRAKRDVGSNVRGGGIASYGAGEETPPPNTTIIDSVIELNVSDGGGGIYQASGELSITNTTVRDNSGRSNGGVFIEWAPATLRGVTVSGNTGGGVRMNGDIVRIENSTVSGNTASRGGGIYATLAIIVNSTITANTADTSEGGIYGTAVVVNSVVLGNSAPRQPDCNKLTSKGYNLLTDAFDCVFTPTGSDILGADPQLGPLADNGGPTLTHALLPGSPAIDAGNPATPGSDPAACLVTDQRGLARPQGSRCDIGAFELVPAVSTTQSHEVLGKVVLEALPNPIAGARVTFANGADATVVTSDPSDGSFRAVLDAGTYSITIDKEGFLPAKKAGLVVNRDMVVSSVMLIWGDVDGSGTIDVKDVTTLAIHLGMEESPWE